MKNAKIFASVMMLGLALTGCYAQTDRTIRSAEWLAGTWENNRPKGTIYETWKRISDNEMSGKSYIIRENDTIVFETIRLLRENNTLYYVPVVKGQNKDQPVRFELKSIAPGEMIFENLQHDFPQLILYRKTGAESLTAEISGTINSKEKSQTFLMTRKK